MKKELAMVVDCVSEGVIYKDASGQIKLFNKAAERILGLSREQAAGLSSTNHDWQGLREDGSPCPPDENPSAITLRTGQALHNQVRGVKRPDGGVAWLSINTQPVFEPGQATPRGVVVTFLDITERKRIEESLRQKSEELERYFAISLDMLCIADTDGFFRRLNPEWEKALGYSLDELEGRRFLDFVHPDDAGSTLEAVGELSTGKAVFNFVNRYLCKDGSYRWIEWRSFPVGQLIYANARDISERRRGEEAQRESERRYRELFNSISDFICTHDLQGRLLTINETACRAAGFPARELVGRNIKEFMPPRFREDFDRLYLTAIMAKGYDEGVTKFLSKNGQASYLEYRNRLIREAGKEPFVIASARDVTERVTAERELHRLQEQLLRSQKIEAVGVLAGGIAHDFNNVLQAISGYAQLLQAEKNLSGIGRERLESIERSIERASRMINQLMTLAHKVDTRHERVDLNQEVWQTVDILKHTLPRMISIKTKLEPELKAISGDPGQIEQVLLNLATNAGHAMPQGGELSFATRGVILNGAERNSWPGLPPGEYVALEVADTGQGMDEATQSRIFEPFFTTKPPGEGTGLGLSTAYGIVTSHGGHVQCRSKPGQGTTFSIIFPVAGAKDQQPPGQAVAQAGDLRGSETILLVDDEKPILDSCREALENFGYRVLTASRGEEALEIFLRAPRSIGLVILDLNMPGMGGLDCIKAMLSADPRAKVMVATGYTEVGVSAAILEMGGLGLIPKPYRFTDLLATIRNVLDSGQTQP